MTTLERLDRWAAAGQITADQHRVLAALETRERVSLYLELNSLLYLGVAAIAAGVAIVARTYFDNLGDGAIIGGLLLAIAACMYYVVTRATPYSPDETESPNMAFDYVLYLACLLFGALIGYLQFRFPPPLSPEPQYVFLISAAVYFVLAYRFDNRFVLSLAISAVAGAFGLTVSKWGFETPFQLIGTALMFSGLLTAGGVALHRLGVKPHFLNTYLHLGALTALGALLGGSYDARYLLGLLVVCGVLAWYGMQKRNPWFVSYALVAAYIGISMRLLDVLHEPALSLFYMLASGVMMLVALVVIARKLGSAE